MTHTKDKAKAATPHHDLIAELLNPNIPKNEREHAAVREIERLQALAAPTVHEPVAWLDEERKIIYWHCTHETDDYHGFKRSTPLYTAPQPAQQEDDADATIIQYHEATIKRLEKRIEELAQPTQQEPIGFVVMENPINPQHRPWVGLTDERIAEITVGFYGSAIHHDDYAFARAIEAELKELASSCPELHKRIYHAHEVDKLEDWAANVLTCIERIKENS
jgi:hypothetical protein